MTWKEFVDDVENVFDKLCKLEKMGAPLVELFAPQIAPEVAMATGIATAVDNAIQANEAAGSTPQSAVVAATTIAQAVAASGAVDTATAGKIQQISTAVASIPPELYTMP